MSQVMRKRRPSTNRPTIRDVARLAGTSTASVSRSLSGSNAVSPELHSRIQSAVRDLNYVPHAGARALSNATTGITNRSVAIVVLAGFDKSYPDFLFMLCASLSKNMIKISIHIETNINNTVNNVIMEMSLCNYLTIVIDRRHIAPRLVDVHPDTNLIFILLPAKLSIADQGHIVDRVLDHVLVAPTVSGTTLSIL